MSVKKLHLQIITPKELKFSESADMVIMRCVTGDLGVLPRHQAYSAVLDFGLLRILNEGEERRIAVIGGYAEILNDKLTVLTNIAEWAEDIDRARAEEDRLRAERLKKEARDEAELKRAEVLLRRSLVFIEVSSNIYLPHDKNI